MMKVLFMGTPDFAVPSLKMLAESGAEIIGVVTQPDRPRGRGKHVVPSPVKEAALSLGLPVYQPRRVREPEFLQTAAALAPDVIIVVAFGQILPPALLQLPRYGCINVHASLLPRYRGAAPVHWVVLNGEKMTGITTMQMDEGLDTGDILMQIGIPIGANETTGSVHDRLAETGAQVLLRTLDDLETGPLERLPQDDAQATYAPLLKPEHEIIDWTKSAAAIHNQIRGLNPWPGAYAFLRDARVKIWESRLMQDDKIAESDAVPGQVVGVTANEGIKVQTGDGVLCLLTVQPANRQKMGAAGFANGHQLKHGEVFGMMPAGSKE